MTPTARDYVRGELADTIAALQATQANEPLLEMVERVGRVCAAAIQAGGKILFCGNGGSAADSQHLAAELVGKLIRDREAMPGLALSVDTSALTAIGNDFGYEYVFARQVEGLGRPGDVIVGLSTSGRSTNVVNALREARQRQMVTVAMTGPDRGPMADVADHWLAVPHGGTQRIQEAHIVLGHIFCALIETHVHGGESLR